MLQENNVRTGFFERDQFAAVRDRLAEPLRAAAMFMYLTGWRISEVLGLQWRHVDFDAGAVRLDPGTTKRAEGREFPFTNELRALLDYGQPVIVLIKTGELPYWSYNTLHAIVLVGYDETHVYANDSHFAQSPQVIPIGDFELAWLEMGNRYITLELAP